MAKKNLKKTKSKIVSAAWKLFYEQGYEDTTIEEIIEESGTSIYNLAVPRMLMFGAL